MRAALGLILGGLAPLVLAPGTSLAEIPSPDRGGHAFAVLGGGSASEGGRTGLRALQLSFGQNIAERVRCDASYVNEGHPTNHHRDGFSAQCWRTQPMSADIRAEVGAGPYFSMDTTTPPGGSYLNEKRLGLVASAAVLYRIRGADTYVRAQYNHVAVPGAQRSNVIMVGLGMDYGGMGLAPSAAGGETQVGIWGGAAEISGGGSSPGTGWQIEARRPFADAMGYSVSALSEAQGGGMLDRKGLALQAWWHRPVAEQWKMSAGAGPMLARDRNLSGDQDKVLGLISFEAARIVAPRTTLSARFNRIISNYDKDADQFMLGAARRF